MSPLKIQIITLEAEIKTRGLGKKKAARLRLKAIKAEYNKERKATTDAIKARKKKVAKAVKELNKLRQERHQAGIDVHTAAEREIEHLNEAAADLLRICSDPDEAPRYFTVVDRAEIEENEFNLNVPRYVDTFEPEENIRLDEALDGIKDAEVERAKAFARLNRVLEQLNGKA